MLSRNRWPLRFNLTRFWILFIVLNISILFGNLNSRTTELVIFFEQPYFLIAVIFFNQQRFLRGSEISDEKLFRRFDFGTSLLSREGIFETR